MLRSTSIAAGAIALSAAAAAVARLGGAARAPVKAGAQAPPFSAQASLGGKVFNFTLLDALKKGPVVLYFYPAAFTSGCTLEAHDFAEHIGDYTRLGATVIGVSGDGIAKLDKFSVSECRSKFPVASDESHAISRAYDAVIGAGPLVYSARTSYVIAPGGKIAYSYRSMNPGKHVANTLAALKKLRANAGAS